MLDSIILRYELYIPFYTKYSYYISNLVLCLITAEIHFTANFAAANALLTSGHNGTLFALTSTGFKFYRSGLFQEISAQGGG